MSCVQCEIPEFRVIFNSIFYVSIKVVLIPMLGVKICTDEKVAREKWGDDVV